VDRCTYLLPIRRHEFVAEEAANFRRYFSQIADAGCEVLVVDGSPADVFDADDRSWSDVCRHVPVDRSFGYLNDKVNGVHTGVQLASCDKVILADDDIRYSSGDVERVCALLDEVEVVRPQNYLAPLPWWARMEAARMLINRATLRIGDYPGTCAFRRETMLRVGHYDGDVLFDNEEIVRHFARHGAAIGYETDFYIRKLPPTFGKWIEQRPRQAYEDFALRIKTGLFFAIPLVTFGLVWVGGAETVAIYLLFIAIAAATVGLIGRARGVASRYFPLSVCAFAPLWVLERALSTYWALYWYLVRGGYPFGEQLLTKGVGRDWFAGGRAASATIARRSPK
jgi:hypothetical protein